MTLKAGIGLLYNRLRHHYLRDNKICSQFYGSEQVEGTRMLLLKKRRMEKTTLHNKCNPKATRLESFLNFP